MLTNAFQHNLTRWKYLKQHIKPHPNLPWGKPRFRVKSKMAAIMKPVIFIFFLNRYIVSELNIVEPHYFLGHSICLHFQFLRDQT